jgi:hypothetical protein
MEETRQIAFQEPVQTELATTLDGARAAVEQLHTTTHDPFQQRRYIASKLVQTIHLLFGAIGALIAIRVVLRLLGANPTATFAEWINGVTYWLTAPFAGLFSTPVVAGNVLEVNALVALVVYALLAWMLGRLAWLLLGETRTGLIAQRRYVRADNLTP